MTAANTSVHMHFNLRTHSFNDRRKCLNTALRTVKLTSTMVRNDQCICARANRQARIFHILNAFKNELAAPALLDPFDIVPVESWIKLLCGPRRQRAHVVNTSDMAHDIAKLTTRCTQHAQGPAWLGGDIDDVRDREFGRCRQTIF